MKDSHVGAMGVIALVAVLLLKFAALASLAASADWLAGRFADAAGRPCGDGGARGALALRPAGRPGGGLLPAAAAAGGGLGRGGAGRGGLGPLARPRAGGLAALPWQLRLLLAAYFYRKIGGATGDTLGAVCELVETVPALTLAVWPIQAGR